MTVRMASVLLAFLSVHPVMAEDVQDSSQEISHEETQQKSESTTAEEGEASVVPNDPTPDATTSDEPVTTEEESEAETETSTDTRSKDSAEPAAKSSKAIKKPAGHNPTWQSNDANLHVITKDGDFVRARDVSSSAKHTTTAGRVVVANVKKFTSFVTLFKSPGGRCYSLVLPMKLPHIKVGQTMPILPGYKHERPFIPALSGFKDVLRGHGCRRWNKMNEVAVLFPVFRSAKHAMTLFPIWHQKDGKTLISKKEQKPELLKIDAYTDMYKVPGLLQLTFEGKADINMTVLKSGKPKKLSAKRTIFRDDEGACVIAEGSVAKVKAGLMYSGAPLMQKINRDYATVHRDLRGDDWIEPFACRNISRVPVLAGVYGYGR